MLRKGTQQLITTGLFIAIGLLLPYFTGHAFGLPGTILLPMHIPVLLCGLLCGPRYGAICGLIVPVLSSAVTGMPAPYPMLPIMAAQLTAVGMVSGLTYYRFKLPIYPAILITMLSGWALYGLCFQALLFAGNGELRALSVAAAIMQGIPGIAVQLILIPAVLTLLKKYENKKEFDSMDDSILSEAQGLIKSGKISCVVIREDKIIHRADGRGVSPLLNLYENEPDKLKNAFVVDKIIGKAAAMLLVLGGASQVYGEVMSVAARTYLTEHDIDVSYGRCIDVVTARDGNGICPIEKSVMDTDNPYEGLARMKDAIKLLMRNAV